MCLSWNNPTVIPSGKSESVSASYAHEGSLCCPGDLDGDELDAASPLTLIKMCHWSTRTIVHTHTSTLIHQTWTHVHIVCLFKVMTSEPKIFCCVFSHSGVKAIIKLLCWLVKYCIWWAYIHNKSHHILLLFNIFICTIS